MSNTTSGSASVTEVSVTSTVPGSVSTTVETTTSTFTSDSSTFTSTSETTSSSVVSVSTVYESPSTIYVPPSTTSQPVVATTSTISVTQSPASTGTTAQPTIVYTTSTAPPTYTPPTSTSTSSSSSSSSPSALSASGSGSSNGSGGLSTGATIAIAVVIPIVAIALAFCLGLFFWRRRKERKSAEEQRKNEIEEYGFNPNNDPSLAPAAYVETGSEMAEDSNGYRGWGTTSSAQRKPSTTLGSGSRNAGAAGAAMSESSSNPGGNVAHDTSPGHGSDGFSNDPLMRNGEGMGAAAVSGAAVGGAAGAAAGRRRHSKPNVHRGPSNASSAYSTGPAHSEVSESELPGSAPAPYYQEEGPYNYIDAQAQHGPYGDGTYGTNGEPVIRNVQARRNTRIERAPAFQQNAGIAQNF